MYILREKRDLKWKCRFFVIVIGKLVVKRAEIVSSKLFPNVEIAKVPLEFSNMANGTSKVEILLYFLKT